MVEFDRDVEALAWARSRVQTVLDRAHRLEVHAVTNHDNDQALQWRRVARFIRMNLLGGEGCSIAAFDERRPQLLESLDHQRIQQLVDVVSH